MPHSVYEVLAIWHERESRNERVADEHDEIGKLAAAVAFDSVCLNGLKGRPELCGRSRQRRTGERVAELPQVCE